MHRPLRRPLHHPPALRAAIRGTPARCGHRRAAAPGRGTPCQAPAVAGKARCRLHGGAKGSGARPGNRNAWKHGRRGAAALDRQRMLRKLWRNATFILTLTRTAFRLRPGEGAELAVSRKRGGPVVPLFLWRDRHGLCHLSRTRPGNRPDAATVSPPISPVHGPDRPKGLVPRNDAVEAGGANRYLDTATTRRTYGAKGRSANLDFPAGNDTVEGGRAVDCFAVKTDGASRVPAAAALALYRHGVAST